MNPTLEITPLPHIEAAVMTILQDPNDSPTPVVEKSLNPTDYQPWGDSNDYPTEVYEKCRTNSIIPSTISWKARALRSGGVRYGVIDGYKPDGTEIFRPIDVPEINEFLDRIDIESYLEEALLDLIWFNHFFAEIALQRDRKKAVSLMIQEATFCRFSKQNPKTGLIEKVFIDGNWVTRKSASELKSVPLIDTYWDAVGNVRKSKATKFIYPVSIASPGKNYYQIPDWHSIIDGDWLSVANKIPKFKSFLMENQMSIKYVIHIPESWWDWKYPGFNSSNKYDDAARKSIMKKEIDRFNTLLTGIENTGKGLFLTFKTDANRNEYTKWEIKALDTVRQSGEYMEESQEASSHILYALNVDGTLIGSTPGKSLGAGSGSDKRVAWNIFIINNKPLQDKVVKPLDFITKYNGWKSSDDKQIVWRFNNYLIATLDTGSSIKTESKSNNGTN